MRAKSSILAILAILFTLILSACGDATATQLPATTAATGATTAAAGATTAATGATTTAAAATGDGSAIDIWFHSGSGGERTSMDETVKLFQAANPDIKVKYVNLPTGDYNAQVQAAAFSRKLPCLLDFDGPNMYNYAWAGLLIPLDKYVTSEMKADILPSIITQGTFQDNKLYSLGQFDSGMGIWANKDLLTKAGITDLPTVDKPWTKDVFDANLAKLKASGVQWPLDFKIQYGVGEWYTYGYSPMVQSFGGDLINRKDYQSATGVVNGPETTAAINEIKMWIDKGYVNGKATADDDFVNGKSALSYVGHWVYPDYKKALGEKLTLLPMVDFGKGAKTGMGSWNWGITKDCKNPDAAWKALNFFMSGPEIKRITDANGAVPARQSVINSNKDLATGGILNVFVQQLLKNQGVPRPITPAYPTITKAFALAMDDIFKGADVKAELDKAAKTIDSDIQQNSGYPINK